MSSPDDTLSNQALSPDEQPTAPQSNVLRIVSGLHGGASRLLATQEMIVIGSGEDCDIVLADAGVARHHALVISLSGVFSLRALDAPLRVDGRPLHPGDPVALAPFQRIELGEVALAVGPEEDDRWAALLPSYDGGARRPSAKRAYLRHLPTVAALAVLSLASVAIFAAVVPKARIGPQPIDRLAALAGQYQITDRNTSLTPDGVPVLTGTVDDVAMREKIRIRAQGEGIEAKIDLRTGNDIAHDVQEVLRSQGLSARARYLGNGDVEVSGRFEDEQALRAAATSRAMIDVVGVKRVIPRNFAAEQKTRVATAAAAAADKKSPAQIVAVVRGSEPHALASDGTRYAVGSELPDGGKLIAIGTHAWALMPDGQTRQVKPSAFANVESTPAAATPSDAAAAASDKVDAAKPTTDVKADPKATPKASTKAAVANVSSQSPMVRL